MGKVFIIQDEDSNEFTGIVVGQKTMCAKTASYIVAGT